MAVVGHCRLCSAMWAITCSCFFRESTCDANYSNDGYMFICTFIWFVYFIYLLLRRVDLDGANYSNDGHKMVTVRRAGIKGDLCDEE